MSAEVVLIHLPACLQKTYLAQNPGGKVANVDEAIAFKVGIEQKNERKLRIWTI